MPLKLTSTIANNKLDNVGKVWLQDNKIFLEVHPDCGAILKRGSNIVTLVKEGKTLSKVSGVPQIGDKYTIERGFEKLTVEVDEQKEFKPPEIYVNENDLNEGSDQKRKTTLTAGGLLLTLLVISVVLGINQKRNNEIQKSGDAKFTVALEKYESSLDLKVEKPISRDNFQEAKKIVDELKKSNYKNEKLDELSDNILKNEAIILGEKTVEIKEFLDLTLQISGFSGKNMVSSGEEIFIFDEKEKQIIKVNLKTKGAKIEANKEKAEGAISIGSYEDRLFLNKNDGIYEVDGVSKKKIERDWNDTKLIYFYAANAYLLDKDANQIYRFTGSIGGFGTKSGWLAPGIEMDLSKISDMVIDGSIWLLSETGRVTKLINGNPTQITLNGIPATLEKPTAIYTNEKQEFVYILEKEKGRVVVIDKKGEFKMQYTSENLKETDDLVVSEEEKKIILLSNSKLMYFEID
jgi:hypothetical protein